VVTYMVAWLVGKAKAKAKGTEVARSKEDGRVKANGSPIALSEPTLLLVACLLVRFFSDLTDRRSFDNGTTRV